MPARTSQHREYGAALVAAGLTLVAAPAHAAEGGLEIFPDPVMLGVLLVLFTLLIWPSNKLVFQPLLRVLDERRARIEGARARADEVAKKAQSVLAHYEETAGAAKDEAELERRAQVDVARHDQAQTSTQARSAAERRVATARAEVAAELERARGQLREEAEPLAREAAARVLGRPLS